MFLRINKKHHIRGFAGKKEEAQAEGQQPGNLVPVVVKNKHHKPRLHSVISTGHSNNKNNTPANIISSVVRRYSSNGVTRLPNTTGGRAFQKALLAYGVYSVINRH